MIAQYIASNCRFAAEFVQEFESLRAAVRGQLAGDSTAKLVWFSEQVHNTVESDPFLAEVRQLCIKMKAIQVQIEKQSITDIQHDRFVPVMKEFHSTTNAKVFFILSLGYDPCESNSILLCRWNNCRAMLLHCSNDATNCLLSSARSVEQPSGRHYFQRFPGLPICTLPLNKSLSSTERPWRREAASAPRAPPQEQSGMFGFRGLLVLQQLILNGFRFERSA